MSLREDRVGVARDDECVDRCRMSSPNTHLWNARRAERRRAHIWIQQL